MAEKTKTIWRCIIRKVDGGYNYGQAHQIQIPQKAYDILDPRKVSQIDDPSNNRIVFIGTIEIISAFISGAAVAQNIDQCFNNMLNNYCTKKSQEKFND